MAMTLIQKFLKQEAAGGLILIAVAILALVWANSPLASWHTQFIDHSLFWINDGLMVFFFLLVGVELKKGFLSGELSNFKQVLLPAFCALMGMLIPACLFVFINWQHPQYLMGWAIPVATDIAFALGVLTFFSKHISHTLKLFLLALAIFDDLGAILIIAFFYSENINLIFFMLSFVCVFALVFLNLSRINSLLAYLTCGILLSYCLYKTGVHPTLAGAITGLMIPHSAKNSKLDQLEKFLHPVVAFLILPLFALANAGFSLKGITLSILSNHLVLGITCGLFLGKQLGIVSAAYVLIRCKLCQLPKNSTWPEFYGVSVLAGIGFTMSLFLGTLSFEHSAIILSKVRVGVILGSIISAIFGVIILCYAQIKKRSRKA